MANNNLSGKAWWSANQAQFTNSTSISKLSPKFRANVIAFKKALEDAGASISVATTKRSEERAYILHWAWKLSKGQVKANKIPSKSGVNIVWDHGTEKASKAGAAEIIKAANVVYEPSLTSNHIKGEAIDWTIIWKGNLTIKNQDGSQVAITNKPTHGGKGRLHNGNKDLHAVGKTYGVIKANFIKIDGPHWSANGR